ncbi:bifunctional 3-phosphoshikimate 1-carboxyvinyltransferase/cytidylate kinase [Leptothrix discophora]|uniref:Multifunctional fusion protein n=1 Tax=Leptothrix discophora TaxID=89 RepID=A0ABT9G675_LEPDI|nr:bifunctional 3-phosphoshikimate 1-carboxyvinyltransferase/cytidylate kinase [Leptothrix discophora]MDP4301989.1 bifunctional 3-phosphoshikimate 1-carboxyvinyltransferase/cytidylate kinase [Leptothrix discophora]
MYDIPHLDLPPLGAAAGTVRLPGSKSISNRLLLLAGLSQGRTTLVDLLDSDDTRVMLAALRTLGCTIEQDGRLTRIDGFAGQPAVAEAELFLGNAGTAMRPLTAALAVLTTQADGRRYTLKGVPRMHERPIGDLVDALRGLGVTVDCLGNEGYPPLRLAGGRLDLAAPVKVRGDVSSQFLTALLLALPLAAGQADVVIEVVGELISKPYIEITLNLLERFGIAVRREGWARFTIPAGSRYVTPGEVHVEGDASSASYFIALGALAGVDAPVRIEGVGSASIQGDIRFVEAAEAMGAQVQAEANALEVRRGAWPLRAIDMDCNAIPDAAMTLAVMALYADGPCTLRNIASWRVKETDRIAAMAAELRKVGAQVEEGVDFIRVWPLDVFRPAAIHTYDDHRMAMCLSLAAFHPLKGAAPVPTRILDPKCVAKTFPDYFETLFEVVSVDPAHIPVITIDGPTASGKGTLAAGVAERLGYHTLDSGSLYRVTALAARSAGVAPEDEAGVVAVARAMKLQFAGVQVLLDGVDVSDQLREEQIGAMASQVAAHPAVRAALFDLQCAFRQLPGLVADGRDMGTVIFPAAPLKVFLTATAAARAERRHKQLISKGIPASLADLRADLEARDARDRGRSTAPLKPAEDALLLDNSLVGIDASVQQVVDWWEARLPFGAHAG